jgi:diguanylate cyclase (GGDEF)-like protein
MVESATVLVVVPPVERDAEADRRDRLAQERDLLARERDDGARQRDLGARRRDRSAGERDRVAMHRDLAAMHRTDPPPAVADRIASARERTLASLDRIHCAEDRRESALDRQMSALDRWQSSVDRLRGAHERRASRDERQRLALDDLTGLHRRSAGLALLQREVERTRRSGGSLVVAFVDVDHLKLVNDRDGHEAGDELLRDVAKALRDCMRSYDVVVRLGGDEFVCGMVDISREVAALRLEDVQRRLGERGASITAGIAALQEEDDAADVVHRADIHLVDARQRRAAAPVRGRHVARRHAHASEVAAAD